MNIYKVKVSGKRWSTTSGRWSNGHRQSHIVQAADMPTASRAGVKAAKKSGLRSIEPLKATLVGKLDN